MEHYVRARLQALLSRMFEGSGFIGYKVYLYLQNTHDKSSLSAEKRRLQRSWSWAVERSRCAGL